MQRVRITVLIAAVAVLGLAFSVSAYDRTEAEGCANCHFAFEAQSEIVDMWFESSHANSYHDRNANDYCARCHSPLQASPEPNNSNQAEPVEYDHWQAVTCASCHPPHDLRVEYDTPIGNYDVFDDEDSACENEESEDPDCWIMREDNDEGLNELCQHCHNQEFQGFGQLMYEQKGVLCVDCHMARVPGFTPRNENDPGVRYSHNWWVQPNLPQSCGAGTAGCHPNRDSEWAIDKIQRSKIHKKFYHNE